MTGVAESSIRSCWKRVQGARAVPERTAGEAGQVDRAGTGIGCLTNCGRRRVQDKVPSSNIGVRAAQLDG